MLPCGSHMEVEGNLLPQIYKDGSLDGGNFELCSSGVIIMDGIAPFISGGIDTGDPASLGEKAKAYLKEDYPYGSGKPILEAIPKR